MCEHHDQPNTQPDAETDKPVTDDSDSPATDETGA